MLCSPGKDGDLLFLQKCGKTLQTLEISILAKIRSRAGIFWVVGLVFCRLYSLTFYEAKLPVSSVSKFITCYLLLSSVLYKALRKIWVLNIF